MNYIQTKKVSILINTITDIKEFNVKASKYSDVDLISGRYRIPANSLMGIFSLDVAEPIKMEYPANIHDEIIKDFGKWIIEE